MGRRLTSGSRDYLGMIPLGHLDIICVAHSPWIVHSTWIAH